MTTGPAWSLVSYPLDWQLHPADVLRLLRDDAHPAALTGAWAGGSDIVCSAPAVVCSPPELPWDALGAPWPGQGADGPPAPDGSQPGGAAAAGFGGGWIGYLGFGLADSLLPVPPAPGGPRQLPSWWLGYYDHVLRRDRASGRWTFEALRTPQRASQLDKRLAELRARGRGARPRARGYHCGDFGMSPPATGHRQAVSRAVGYIRQGDIFQANICLRLEAGFDGDPLDAFCAAASRLDPPQAAFLRVPGGAVASLSPELFLRREGAIVTSRPIKGTRARPRGRAQSAASLASLERSAKNRAENIMIVDLMRNDLSRVCEPGSVRVPRLVAAEPHPGIWHLVSEVTGQLLPGVNDGDLLRASFPPGSVTGAPKVRAIEIIHELEASPREVYTGAIGYRSPAAGLELNVAIRTFEFHSGRVWLGAGGGIVAASRPAEEFQECLLKAAPLIRALGGRLQAPGTAPGSLPAAGRSLRPRAAAGVFTSLLVTDGRAPRLNDHLERLDASARELYGKGLPPGLHDDLAACLARRPSGRLRVTVRPLGGPLRATIEVVPLDGPPPAAADLSPVVIPGGVGAHKWRDRRLLAWHAQAAGADGPGHQLLIEDSGGDLLETDRGSIFAITGGVLRTPAADGRQLPGTARAAVLAVARDCGIKAEEIQLTRRDLERADEAFVTNAVQGVLPVRSVAGVTLPLAPGPVTSRLSAALSTAAGDVPGTADAGVQRPGPARPGAAFSAHSPHGPAVVVIDNYDSFTYNLAHQLISAGCKVEVVRNDEVSAAQVAAFSPAGVVISPGPCSPDEAGISIAVVRACEGTPVLGICLGHQAIAACYGASIVRAPRPVHGQTATITHDGRGVLAGLPQRFRATRYHSLIADGRTLPSCLTVTAQTRGGIPMGIRHTALPAEGVQFHPESVLTSHGQAIIASFARSLSQ